MKAPWEHEKSLLQLLEEEDEIVESLNINLQLYINPGKLLTRDDILKEIHQLKERLYETRKQISMRLNHEISYNIPGDE